MGYNQYDSDYQIRLATLGALGGDTAKTYDSVYDIDLEILRLTEQGGGGGGMSYEQIQQALTETGVTGIKFTQSGLTDQTLSRNDVALLNSNGGQYICPNLGKISNVSGNVTDGAIMYLGQYIDDQHKMVVTTDYQDNDANDAFKIRVNYGNDEEYYIKLFYGGNNIQLRDINDSEQGNAFDCLRHDDLGMQSPNMDDITSRHGVIPLKFHFANGATGTLVTANYVSNDPWNVREVFYLDKYNNAFPTVTFEYNSDNKTIVETGATEELVRVNIPAKGWYKYYFGYASLENGTLEYDIFYDAISKSEFQTMMQHYDQYHMPLSIRFHVAGYNEYSDMDLICHSGEIYYNRDSENPQKEVRFVSNIIDNAGGGKRYFNCFINYDNTNGWYYRGGEFVTIPTNDDLNRIRESVKESICGADTFSDFGKTTLYNIAMSGSVSMEIWKMSVDSSEYDITDFTGIGYLYNNRNGATAEIKYKNGKLKFRNVEFDAVSSPSWQVMDYRYFTDNNANKWDCVAIKISDDGNGEYSVYVAIPAITGSSRWDESAYEFNKYEDEWKVWTQETGETITQTPHLYSTLQTGRENDTDVIKLVQMV